MAKTAKRVKISPAANELLANFIDTYEVEPGLVTAQHAEDYLTSLGEDVDYNTDTFFNHLVDENVLEGDEEEEEDTSETTEEENTSDENARAVAGVSITNADATNIGRKLDQQDEVRNYIHESIDVDEKRRRLPANVAFALFNSLTSEEMAVVPRPSSKYTDDPTPNIYDIGKPGTTPWFATAFDSMKEGADLNKAIDVLDAYLKPDPVPIPALYVSYLAKTPKWLESERDMLKQRRNSGIKALRNAFSVLFRFDDVETQLKDVYAEFRVIEQDGKKTIERTTAPIRVYTVIKNKKTGRDTEVDKYLGINAFLRATTKDHLKLIKATSDHFQNFMPPKVTRGKKDEKLQPVVTVPQAVHVVEEMTLSFKQDQSFRAGLRTYAMQDENVALLYALHELRTNINLICDMPSAAKKIRDFEAALKAAADKTDKPAA